MIDTVIGSKYNLENIIVFSGAEITDDLILECRNNFIYKLKESVKINPDFSFIFVQRGGKEVIGYFFALPVKVETAVNIFNKKLDQNDLVYDDFDIDPTKFMLDLQILSADFKEEYRDSQIIKMLFELFINSAIRKAKGGKFINYIYTEKKTEFDSHMIQIFGLDYLCVSKSGGKIFGASFEPALFQKIDNYELLDFAYTNIFAKYRIEKQDLYMLSQKE